MAVRIQSSACLTLFYLVAVSFSMPPSPSLQPTCRKSAQQGRELRLRLRCLVLINTIFDCLICKTRARSVLPVGALVRNSGPEGSGDFEGGARLMRVDVGAYARG